MRTTESENASVPHARVTLAVILTLCGAIHHSLGMGQDADVKKSLVQASDNQGSLQVEEERRDLERERQEARKTVDEFTKELLRSTLPNPFLYVERGHAYMSLGEYGKAFDDYTKAIESPTRRGSAYFILRYRVFAAVGKGDYVQAEKDAAEMTRASPPQAEAFAVRALILARSPDDKVKNAKYALECAMRASTIADPGENVVLVQRALAAAYSVNGDFKESVAHQEMALAAIKGKIPSEMKAELNAYKAGRECPFPVEVKKNETELAK